MATKKDRAVRPLAGEQGAAKVAAASAVVERMSGRLFAAVEVDDRVDAVVHEHGEEMKRPTGGPQGDDPDDAAREHARPIRRRLPPWPERKCPAHVRL